MAELLMGAPLAKKIKEQVAADIKNIKDNYNLIPSLCAVEVGNTDESRLYLDFQKKVSEKLGVRYQIQNLPEKITEEKLIAHIQELNADKNINGIILQLPLPRHIQAKKIIAHITPAKDVEGVHPENLGKILWSEESIAPCTACAVMCLLEETKQDLRGKETVVIGHSEVVGKPLSLLLLNKLATVTVCHVATSERALLEKHVREAEILVVAVGKEDLVKGDWIRPGSTVIDVGINYKQGKLCGDVEFEPASRKAAFITPVPGGVGPLTVAILMKNLVMATKLQLTGKIK